MSSIELTLYLVTNSFINSFPNPYIFLISFITSILSSDISFKYPYFNISATLLIIPLPIPIFLFKYINKSSEDLIS